MMQVSGLYTVGGLVMMLFLSACAATGSKGTEGPTPSVRDRLAPQTTPMTGDTARRSDDDIPVAG
ncbi:MAG: hypothetical protein E4G93_03435 [Dehalococcoidia bacterium]|nr:MAG: hypothetical protein E4G93_03435 [Dehalococcoidia bacterium]